MSDQVLDGNFGLASACSPFMTEAPFEGDAGRYLAREDYVIDSDYFEALPLNTEHPVYSGYYLVGESQPENTGVAGIVKWTRFYAKVPADRSDYESFAATLPGLGIGGDNDYHTINAVTYNDDGTMTVQTSDAHDLEEDDVAWLFYRVNVFSVDESQGSQPRNVIEVPTTSTFKVTAVFPANPPTFTFVVKADTGRDPQTKVVRSRVDKKYYLPSVTPGIASVDDIPVLNPVQIINPLGQVVTTYQGETTPDIFAYLAQVDAKEWVVAEATSFRRWKGNIIEASTRYIVAE